ncbi:hypothetical protein QEN19_001002 [Hanseniaspora menglaensis]
MNSTYSLLKDFNYPKTQKAIIIEQTGGPEVLKYADIAAPSLKELKPSEVIVKIKYSGINLIETYFRKGIYPVPLPYTLGREASGKIVATGSNVSEFNLNDYVVFLKPGSFCQYVKVDTSTDKVINIGAEVSDEILKQYTASMLQGLTALAFVEEAYPVKKGDYILNYAAAGGVGSILNQLLKLKGAHTIAVASTEEKLKIAVENGAEFTILNDDPDFVNKIKSLTPGNAGTECIFDSIGKETFENSLAIVKRKGTIISYGNASGPVEPLSINRLSAKNVKIARPQLFAYITTPEEFEYYTSKLFKLISEKQISINIFDVFNLKDYSEATKLMEARKTTGKLVLEVPQ